MANRKRKMVLRCPVTEEERKLIEYKMSLVPTNQIGAYYGKWRLTDISSIPIHQTSKSLTPSSTQSDET